MNELHIIGYAYKPEVKSFSNGRVMSRFALKYGNGKDKSGKWQNAFIPVKLYADMLLKDGDKVEVWGRIACDEWTDKQGNKQKTTYIWANRVGTEEKEQEQKQDFVNDELPPF